MAGLVALLVADLLYWAFAPLYDVDIQAPDPLTLGSAVTTTVISAGGINREPFAELALVQGNNGGPIGFNTGFGRRFASLRRPFARRSSFTLTIGPDLIRKFEDGPAVLVVTLKGRSRWYRLEEISTYRQKVTLAKP